MIDGLPYQIAELPVARVRFVFEARGSILLPEYAGSTFRGAFGRALRDVVCLVDRRDCARCMLFAECAYPAVFETPRPGDSAVMPAASRVPHPFVLDPPHGGPVEAGEKMDVVFTLAGTRTASRLPYFILAMERAGRRGFGPGRGEAALRQVRALLPGGGERAIYDGETRRPAGPAAVAPLRDWLPAIPRGATRATLTLLTPLRLFRDGMPARNFDFPLLLKALLRRLGLLAALHGGGRPEVDRDGLLRRGAAVRLEAAGLRWHDWERWSSRQQARMKLGGFLGEAALEGDLDTFASWLAAGEVLRAGKGSSFGLGRYSCRFSGAGRPAAPSP